MSFHVGQLVMQKGDLEWDREPHICVPRCGVVYTIRSIEAALDGTDDLFLALEEIRNPPEQYADEFGEPVWFADEFRPLSESRLAIFRQHLAPSPKVEA